MLFTWFLKYHSGHCHYNILNSLLMSPKGLMCSTEVSVFISGKNRGKKTVVVKTSDSMCSHFFLPPKLCDLKLPNLCASVSSYEKEG